ncbi:hypothetical protein [Terasakiella sp.]|uniref:hypothetical protein n=1 Tax=Terasakiella sp. TaxID=2034861 RepID=UPI003AA7CF5C
MIQICHWDEIPKFRSIIEFNKFNSWISSQIEKGNAEEILTDETYHGLEKRRIKCLDCNTTWILVSPDPGYFPGFWKTEESVTDNR